MRGLGVYSITIIQKLMVPIAPLCTVGGSDCYKPSQGFTSELVAPIRHVSALISFKCALGTFYCRCCCWCLYHFSHQTYQSLSKLFQLRFLVHCLFIDVKNSKARSFGLLQNTIRWRSDQFWYTCWRSWRKYVLDPWSNSSWYDLEGRFWYINLCLTSKYIVSKEMRNTF